MNLIDLKAGIQEALIKATLVTPAMDDDAGWAEWVRWQTVYLYEFVVRSRQKGMSRAKAQRLAAKAMRTQLRDEVSAALLTQPLPQEEEADDVRTRAGGDAAGDPNHQ